MATVLIRDLNHCDIWQISEETFYQVFLDDIVGMEYSGICD